MNAGDITKYGNLTLLGAIDGVTAEQADVPGACGVWSIRQLVAHLSSYEAVFIDILARFTGDAVSPALDRFKDPASQFNDAEVAARAPLSFTETIEEYERYFARSSELLARIPENQRSQTGTIPWYGAEYALDDLIVYLIYGHKREHCGQIAVFRDRFAG